MRLFTRTRVLVGCALVAACAATAVPSMKAGASSNSLNELHQSIDKFQNFDLAGPAGYGLFTDAKGIACIDNPGTGAMGVHFVNGNYVGDAHEFVRQPEALVYEPQANGSMRLVAVEYVVLKSAWEAAGNTQPPSLFGQQFMRIPAGNRYGLPEFYALHVWAWKTNPAGMFAMWNPDVTCAHAAG
jgi:hypothetical protein